METSRSVKEVALRKEQTTNRITVWWKLPVVLAIALSLPKRCNFTPRNVHERFQTLLTPVLTLFTDFLSAVVTSEIAQILSLYGGGFLALKWQS